MNFDDVYGAKMHSDNMHYGTQQPTLEITVFEVKLRADVELKMLSGGLFDRLRNIEMAKNYCYLVGIDPDEVVAGYIVDEKGQRHRVSKARWRWYQDMNVAQNISNRTPYFKSVFESLTNTD